MVKLVYTEGVRARRQADIRRKVYRKRPVRCPVCRGLECLCRPRYFSGQLLSEADLNAEQQYVIKKNRLHNLYLHGWGVVCGLEVVCHPTCDGWVTIKEGYAISPCGDDIIVCEDTDFDVLKKIEECTRERRRLPADCSPRATPTIDCDPDGCWYLTIRYNEYATRAITTLRRDKTDACACGTSGSGAGRCTCDDPCRCGRSGGNGGGGCNCGGTKTVARNGTSGRTSMARPAAPPACEPTRTCESFVLDLCKAPADEERCTNDTVLGDSLLGRIQVCAEEICRLREFRPSQNEDDTQKLYEQCCRFLRAVKEYFEDHPTTHCNLLDELAKIRCLPPDTGGNPIPGGTNYRAAVLASADQIDALLIRAFLDCICMQLMPPCPEDPGDDRIYLACITVKGGKVVDVCNWRGRRIVWTWPAVLNWLSIRPEFALLSCLLEELCCGDAGLRFAQVLLQQACGREKYAGNTPIDPFAALGQLSAAGTGGLMPWLAMGMTGFGNHHV